MKRTEEFQVEEMRAEDWPAVRAIYLEGISTGNATFETSAPRWEEWDEAHLRSCRLVARAKASGALLAWAALSPVSRRPVYRGVAEVSVYVADGARGMGLGRLMLEALVQASEEEGIWTLQAGILAENLASLKLHRVCGFREVGRRERIGKLYDAWRDVILMERRSTRAGVD